jgi:similar to stage IV sporulation protein
MLYIYRFFCGILELELSGIYPEKILNLCAKNRISVWNTRVFGQKIRFYITVKDFKKLPEILKKSGIRVHILKKKGFPFFINRYKKRLGVFVGIVLFISCLQFMSSFIWNIDVIGNRNVEKSEIISICEDLGIKVGVKSGSIDTKNKVQELLLKTDKLSWASFNIEGCKLTVNVSEITPKNENNAIATNLKASEDGIIKKIDVTSGNCVVSVGDTVKKGDILVSGIIENASGTKFVHSMGSVLAETKQVITLSGSYAREEIYPIGKYKKKSVLEIFVFKIPLYIGKEKGEFITETKIHNLKLFSQSIPIKFYTKKYSFIKKQTKNYNYEEVCNMLKKELLLKGKKEKFTVESEEFLQNEDGVTLNAVISATKDITYSENIIFAIGK